MARSSTPKLLMWPLRCSGYLLTRPEGRVVFADWNGGRAWDREDGFRSEEDEPYLSNHWVQNPTSSCLQLVEHKADSGVGRASRRT